MMIYLFCYIFVSFIVFNNVVIEATENNASIIIVGAGISGLAAADELINTHGFKNVKILEGLNRIGGRIHPIPFENGQIMMGAEWVHGQKNPTFELAKRLEALAYQSKRTRYDGDKTFLYTQNGCQLDSNYEKKFEELAEFMENYVDEKKTDNPFSGSLGQLNKEAFEAYVADNPTLFGNNSRSLYDAFYEIIQKSFQAENAVDDWNNASLRQDSEWTPTVGGKDIPLGPLGYKPILDYFANRIPIENIRFNNTVKKITYSLDNEPVMIETMDNQIYSADHVIVTSSIGYLKRNAKGMFDPPLSDDKLNTIKALGFGNLGKVFLVYNESFWDEDTGSLYFLRLQNGSARCKKEIPATVSNNETELSKIFFTFEPKPFFKNVILAFISSPDVPLMESATNEEISVAATKSFRNFFNNPNIPEPTRIIRSSWNSNPLFYGSYSFYSTDCDLIRCKRSTLASPVIRNRRETLVPVILFAGEATSDHEFQTTHGALLSGRREAKRIHDVYSRR